MTDRHPKEPSSADFRETAKRSQDAGIADEGAAYANAADNNTGGADEEKSTSEGRSSSQPAEGSEVAAPRLPGSPD